MWQTSRCLYGEQIRLTVRRCHWPYLGSLVHWQRPCQLNISRLIVLHRNLPKYLLFSLNFACFIVPCIYGRRIVPGKSTFIALSIHRLVKLMQSLWLSVFKFGIMAKRRQRVVYKVTLRKQIVHLYKLILANSNFLIQFNDYIMKSIKWNGIIH